MLQLPKEALIQYEELQALLESPPAHVLPNSFWPLVCTDITNSTASDPSSHSPSSPGQSSTTSPTPVPSSDEKRKDLSIESVSAEGRPTVETSSATTSTSTVGTLSATVTSPQKHSVKLQSEEAIASQLSVGIWGDSVTQGESIFQYSINVARMKVLKNKIGVFELQKYVFARRYYFYNKLGKYVKCAEISWKFVTMIGPPLRSKLESISGLQNAAVSLATATSSSSLPDQQSNSSNTPRPRPVAYNHGGSMKSKEHLLEVPIDSLKASLTVTDMLKLADVWVLCTAIMLSSSTIAHALSMSGASSDFAIEERYQCLEHACKLLQFCCGTLERGVATVNCCQSVTRTSSLCHDMAVTYAGWSSLGALREQFGVIFDTRDRGESGEGGADFGKKRSEVGAVVGD